MIGGNRGGAAETQPSAAGPMTRRRLLTIVGAGVVGGGVIGGMVGALVGTKPGGTESRQLESVPTASLPQVQGTLTPSHAAQIIEEARRCREPLARIAVWHSPNTRGGTVRIVSRGYQSPPFALTTAPSLVAFPYPAPYSSGRGILTLVGEANDVIVALRPQYMSNELKGSVPIQVWWTPVEGCP
jgi:hypothetical protein